MEAFLRGLLPRLLGEMSFQIYPSQCKDDLLKHLPQRLRGYSSWLPSDHRILIVVDRDQEDCRHLKGRLEEIARFAGLRNKGAEDNETFQVMHRIATEELEAWYFGDWDAVQKAFPKVPSTIPQQARYRNSDEIAGGTWEALEQILQRSGYFVGGLRKIELARTLGDLVDPVRNRSSSFQVFSEALAQFQSYDLSK